MEHLITLDYIDFKFLLTYNILVIYNFFNQFATLPPPPFLNIPTSSTVTGSEVVCRDSFFRFTLPLVKIYRKETPPCPSLPVTLSLTLPYPFPLPFLTYSPYSFLPFLLSLFNFDFPSS